MKFSIIVALLLLVLGGCTTTSKTQPYLAKNPIYIELSELSSYWVQLKSRYNVNTDGLEPPDSNGYVKVRFLVDSNGQVFNPEIVESVPKGGWDQFALRALSSNQYDPSELNVEKVPVYVTKKITFNGL